MATHEKSLYVAVNCLTGTPALSFAAYLRRAASGDTLTEERKKKRKRQRGYSERLAGKNKFGDTNGW
jgi:hypothetical protein